MILHKTKIGSYAIVNDIDGNLVIDYKYLDKYYPGLYQRARLVIYDVTDDISSCVVYWSDANLGTDVDSKGNLVSRISFDGVCVKTIIYTDLLFDEDYVDYLMTSLLKKERVLKYVKNGSEYIGSIDLYDSKYYEIYDKDVVKYLKKKEKNKKKMA